MATAYELATGAGVLNFSFIAGADLRTHQFKFVKLNASAQIVLCDTDGEPALGVLQDTPNSGEAGDVMLIGISKVVVAAGEVIPIGEGSMVGTTNVGTATRVQSTPTTGADVGDMMMGMWLDPVTGSSPAGVLGTALIRPMGRVAIT